MARIHKACWVIPLFKNQQRNLMNPREDSNNQNPEKPIGSGRGQCSTRPFHISPNMGSRFTGAAPCLKASKSKWTYFSQVASHLFHWLNEHVSSTLWFCNHEVGVKVMVTERGEVELGNLSLQMSFSDHKSTVGYYWRRHFSQNTAFSLFSLECFLSLMWQGKRGRWKLVLIRK